MKRVCLRRGPDCSDDGFALPGRSRCARHGGKAWGRQPTARQAAYSDPLYKRNRAQILSGAPLCYWCRSAPATTADHLVPVSRGGGNDLTNLVGSCRNCNEARGAAEGRRRLKGGPNA